MTALEILYLLVLGITIGAFIMWGICNQRIVKPMRKELVSVLRDNCEAMHAVVDNLNHIQAPTFVVEGCGNGDDQDENNDEGGTSETESPPILLFSSPMICVDDSGNQVNRTINFSEQQ